MKKLLSYLIVCIMSMSVLSGCATPKPSDTVDTFLKAVKEQDASKISSCYTGENITFENLMSDEDDTEESEESVAMVDLLESTFNEKMLNFDYEIGEEKIEGDKATVVVSFTTYNLGSAYTLFFSDYISKAFTLIFSDISDEEMEKMGTEILREKIDSMSKSYKKDVTFVLTKKDKNWVIDKFEDEEEFFDVILGGLLSEIENLSNSFDTME